MSKTQTVPDMETVIRTFVGQISSILEHQSEENMRQKLASILGAEVAPARRSVKATGTTRKAYTRKTCPVPGCKNLGAPRYSWICKEHGQEFKKEGKAGEEKANAFIAAAEKPGGPWYVEGREAKVKRGPGRPRKADKDKAPQAPAATA